MKLIAICYFKNYSLRLFTQHIFYFTSVFPHQMISRRVRLCLPRLGNILYRSYTSEVQRDVLEYDVVIVGAGPAGLSAAIRLKQLEEKTGRQINVCVLEKGSEPGAHILSGCCFDPRALNELFPDWKNMGTPVKQAVTKDKFMFMFEKNAITPPLGLPSMDAHGCYVISLSMLTRWLAEQATSLGVEIYSGFAVADVLYNEDGAVRGVVTGDMGISKEGHQKDSYTPGVEVVGKQTIFAEGCRGSASLKVMKKFNLNANSQMQTYALGVKELWIVPHAVAQQKSGRNYCFLLEFLLSKKIFEERKIFG